jgi:hypothetical protein
MALAAIRSAAAVRAYTDAVEADLSFFDMANVSARARRRPRGAEIPRNRADPVSTLT